jgi:putative N6-adenine-specific DNA methylase
MENYQMIAKTLAGLENVLFAEIEAIGASNITKGKRAVFFEGNDEIMMKANIGLRSAINILIPVFEFTAEDEYALYDEIFSVQWEDIFGLDNTFSITATISGDLFTHSKYVALKTKDAMADRFRKKFGRRPNVDPSNADYQFNIRILNDQCTISLNSSGETLNKRGYRRNSNEAPLNEVLAAGIILMSDWDKKVDFYDPMSGSGTFGIEAALMARNIAPGLNRSFSFQNWTDYNVELFQTIRQSFQDKIIETDTKIYCQDLEEESIDYIYENAERAGVLENIIIKQEDYFNSSKLGDNGIVFLNPPYGERLEITEINSFYKSMGDQLKKQYTNCEAWIISSNLEALKYFGLKPTNRYQMFNGGLECKLHHYKLY